MHYIQSHHIFPKLINRLFFLLVCIEFLVGNIVVLIWRTFKLKYIEFLAQISIKVSIFFLACPSIFTGAIQYFSLLSKTIEHSDNLIAIKNILYIESPLFLIVSIVSLLVALIGAAVLSRSSFKQL